MRLFAVFFAASLLHLAAACEHPATGKQPRAPADPATGETPEAATYVLAAATLYYKSGPQQGRPPDGTWPAGTKVQLISGSGSYSLVKSPDGTTGYVESTSLQAF